MWKQTILIYLIAITTADGITSPNNNSLPCENMTECHCYVNGNFSVNVNCSDTCLTAKDVCGICSIIENVTGLDISANSIMELPPYCFKDCYKLMWLSLANNSLSTLQNDTFSGLSKLQYLNLDANRLMRYGNFSNPESLRPFKQLLTIHLQSNSNETAHGNVSGYLPNIPSDIIPNVFTIYVDGLPNATFGANFKNLKSLKHLYFSGKWANCKISALTNETFKSVAFLTHLDLSRCKIKYVDAGTFAMLTELRHLNMSFNLELGFPALRNVSYGLQFTKLEVLDYSKVYKTFGLTTQLNRCDVWFLRNTSIKELYINSNRLALIEINALALFPKAVETVHAEDNKFTYGEYALQIGCLKKLKSLYLGKQDQTHSITGSNEEKFLQENRLDTSGHCELSEYPVQLPCNISLNTTKLFDMTIPENLEILDFSSSARILDPVPYIESPIPIKSRIRFVNISGNIMSTLQGSYFSLDTLAFLDLSNNYCSNLSGGFFSNFPNLTQLNASGNKLGPDLAADKDGTIFEPLKKLLILDLSDNWIQILSEKIFTHLQSIKSMDLSLNRLDNITFEYGTMKQLSKLDVRQNKITTLPLGLLEQMDAYSKRYAEQIAIDLSENILSVSCENLPFLTWMKEHSKYFVGIDSYLFQNDGQSAFTYEQLSDFGNFEKNCKSYTAVIVVSSIFVSLFISLIFAGLVYRYRWRLRYLYYMAKARYNGYIPLQDREGVTEFIYDAFISYANENYRFVTGVMFQKLEESGLTLCLHQKDFLPGNYIAENILHAIRNSKKTVIVLSNGFLDSNWCMYEFNMARMENIYSRDDGNMIVVVKYEDFDLVRATPELRECLESESYLEYTRDEYNESYFWEMLIEAIRAR